MSVYSVHVKFPLQCDIFKRAALCGNTSLKFSKMEDTIPVIVVFLRYCYYVIFELFDFEHLITII